jgi:hypothetical protein
MHERQAGNLILNACSLHVSAEVASYGFASGISWSPRRPICLSRIHAVEDVIKARLGSVCPGGTAVPAVLSDRDGRDARAPWPRGNSLTK